MEELPDEAQEHDLHARLLAGDPVASHEVASAFLLAVVERLQQRFRRLDDETLIWDAASDAILNYAERPAQFDPTRRRRLLDYLVMSADGDLRNALASRSRRRAKHEVPSDRVELLLDVRNIDCEEPSDFGERDDATATSNMDVEEVKRKVAEVITGPTDWQVVELMLQGERGTIAFAEVLGITHLDELEQRRIVYRVKDRLKRRLARLGVRLRERG